MIDLSNGKFDKQSLYILLSSISRCGPVAEGNTELMDGFNYIEYMVKKYNVELNLSYSQSEVSAYLVNMDDTDNEKRNFITQFSRYPTQSLYDIINNADLKNSKPDE